MATLKSIFARCWAVWALVVFSTTVLVVWLVLVLCNHRKEYARTAFFQRVSRVWMHTFFFCCAFRVRIHGAEKVNPKETYIFICNHRSFMDIFIMTPFIPVVNKTIGRKEFMSIPFLSRVYGSGTVLVDRKSMTSRQKSYQQMKEVLAAGCSMCIYPEGTRNRTDKPLLPFQRGTFLLAKETNKPIVPVVLVGSDRALSARKTLYAMPTTVDVYFLDPVYMDAGESDTELRSRIEKMMADFYTSKIR